MVAKRKPSAKKPTSRKTTARTSVKKPAVKKIVPSRPEKTLTDSIKKTKLALLGNKIHVLSDVPWESKALVAVYGATWNSDLKVFTYVGSQLPDELKQYKSDDYSFERWVEEEVNGTFTPPISNKSMSPRPHQQVAIDKIDKTSKRGFKGFIVADNVGLGKTISSLEGASKTATTLGFSKKQPASTLIVCPKSVIPHWRNALRALGVDNLRVVVINYDRLKKLLTIPSTAQTAKTTRTKNKRISNSGNPVIRWDIIIADESHKLKNYEESQRAKAFERIARYMEKTADAPYIIYNSATIGQTPVDLGYMAPLIGQMVGKTGLTMKNYSQWLVEAGFNVKPRKVGVAWVEAKPSDTPARRKEIQELQQQDITRLRQILFSPNSPSIRRNPEDIVGWPEVNRIPQPYDLDSKERVLYTQAWLEFRKFLKLNPRGKNPQGALAAQTRYRQKASLVMAPHTLEFALDLLDNGLQVAVSVEFMETLELLRVGFEKHGYEVAEFSGANSAMREQERLSFQKGQKQVILFTVEEGVSFHAGEQLPDGSNATSTPRATIIHDIRYSSISCSQIEGRCHRDGQAATVYYPYANKTVQNRIVTTMITRMANMRNLSGDDASIVEEIENLIETY